MSLLSHILWQTFKSTCFFISLFIHNWDKSVFFFLAPRLFWFPCLTFDFIIRYSILLILFSISVNCQWVLHCQHMCWNLAESSSTWFSTHFTCVCVFVCVHIHLLTELLSFLFSCLFSLSQVQHSKTGESLV